MSLTDLPNEVLSNIMDCCPVASLESLGLTCRTLRTHIELPLRYRQVVVQTHKNRNNADISEASVNVAFVHKAYDRYGKQVELFILASMQRLIQEFSWTISTSHEDYTNMEEGFSESQPPWNAFRMMSSLRKIHVKSDLCPVDRSYLQCIPPFHFGSSHPLEIKLAGDLDVALVRSILQSSALPTLRTLQLDNVRDPGHYNGTYPFRHQDICDVPCSSRFVHQDCDDYRFNGNIRGILPSIEHSCHGLEKFHYRKSGWCFIISGFSVKNDERCYRELASFLSNTSSRLEHIVIEQSVPAGFVEAARQGTSDGLPRRYRGWPPQKFKPMDERFVSLVWPTLLENSWPKLKSLKIVGVGNWGKNKAITRFMKQRLRRHLGRDVEIIYEPVSENPCEAYS